MSEMTMEASQPTIESTTILRLPLVTPPDSASCSSLISICTCICRFQYASPCIADRCYVQALVISSGEGEIDC